MFATPEDRLVGQETDSVLQFRAWAGKVALRAGVAFGAGALLLPSVTGVHIAGCYLGGGLCGLIGVLIVETSPLLPPFIPVSAAVVLLLKVLGPIFNCAYQNPFWLGSPNRLRADASEIAGFTLYASIAILLWLTVAMAALWPAYRQAAQSRGSGTGQPVDARREQRLRWLAWSFVGIGTFFNLFDSYFWGLPPAFYQILYQFSNVRFVGCAFLIMRRKSWLAPAMAMGLSVIPLIRSTILVSTFGTMILLWCFITYSVRPGYVMSLVHVCIAVCALVVLSSAKYDMRTDFGRLDVAGGERVRWSEMHRIRRQLPAYYLSGKARPFSKQKLFRVLKRTDEGTVLGMTMRWTGRRVPFAGGETLWRALYSAFMPRFLAPDKLRAGGVENYVRYAGGKGYGETSINIGQIAEFYANFGYFGGLIAYAFEGFLFGLYIRWMYRVLQRDAFGIAWFGMLLGGIGDIGVEVLEFVGSLVKAFMLTIPLRWALKNFISKPRFGLRQRWFGSLSLRHAK